MTFNLRVYLVSVFYAFGFEVVESFCQYHGCLLCLEALLKRPLKSSNWVCFRGFVKEPSWEGEKDNPRGVTSVSRERVLSNVSHTVKPATETTD